MGDDPSTVDDGPLGDGVLVDFIFRKELHTVHFMRRPLGLSVMYNMMPARVFDVSSGGYAEELGVQRGWVFVAVNGQFVNNIQFETFYTTVRSALKMLPCYGDGNVSRIFQGMPQQNKLQLESDSRSMVISPCEGVRPTLMEI